jgi:hypothetical protein
LFSVASRATARSRGYVTGEIAPRSAEPLVMLTNPGTSAHPVPFARWIVTLTLVLAGVLTLQVISPHAVAPSGAVSGAVTVPTDL